MKTSGAVMFAVAFLYGALGIGLLYDAIHRMRQAGVPPFNQGLYTAIWTVPPPPTGVIQWCDAWSGRILTVGSILCVPVLSAWLAVRHRWFLATWVIMGAWSIASGLLGIWAWIFSRFA